MGKKSKGSTKGGKFMNPTDKSRKEARKKELKKNKKQRLAVRQAVIKQKDPHQILAELERLDDIEYDVNGPSLNEKVLADKRKKLNETWDRLMKSYVKEEKERFGELKRLEGEYELRRREKKTYYESVRSARSVDLDAIPLPSLPTATAPETSSILKKPPSLSTHYSKITKEPPGPPPGPIPDLSDFEDDEEEDAKKRVRFGNTSATPSNDVDDFLKEIEELPKFNVAPPIPLAIRPPAPPGLIKTPVLNPNIRPPVFPFLDPSSTSSHQGPKMHSPNVPTISRFNRPPITIQKPLLPPSLAKKDEKGKQSATIEAKPQLRNLSVDSTRFTPLALRVKRPENKLKKMTLITTDRNFSTSGSSATKAAASTDDAYDQFMKEMEGIL